MTVEVWMDATSQAIIFPRAKNAYQKGDLYCVYNEDGKVHKFPIMHLFRVIESYT